MQNLAFAKLHELSEAKTLALFGDYYRSDVLKNPEGSDHQNIRNFIREGWAGVAFEGEASELRLEPDECLYVRRACRCIHRVV